MALRHLWGQGLHFRRGRVLEFSAVKVVWLLKVVMFAKILSFLRNIFLFQVVLKLISGIKPDSMVCLQILNLSKDF